MTSIDRLSKYIVAFRDTVGSIVDMARYFPSDGFDLAAFGGAKTE